MRVPFFSGTINSASTIIQRANRKRENKTGQMSLTGHKWDGIGGYSVAADVGCVLCTVCRILRGVRSRRVDDAG